MSNITLDSTNIVSSGGNSEKAKSVINALAGAVTWHFVHLENPTSSKNGKFYRVVICESHGAQALTQWGARPGPYDFPTYGYRGQSKFVGISKARELLQQKRDKGYGVVAEGTIKVPLDATALRLQDAIGSALHHNEFTQGPRLQWHGWS